MPERDSIYLHTIYAIFTPFSYNEGMIDIFNWVVKSSADPEKVSLFVKGLVFVGLFLGVDSTVVNQFGNELANLAVLLGTVAAAIVSVFGLARKIYLTAIAKYS